MTAGRVVSSATRHTPCGGSSSLREDPDIVSKFSDIIKQNRDSFPGISQPRDLGLSSIMV